MTPILSHELDDAYLSSSETRGDHDSELPRDLSPGEETKVGGLSAGMCERSKTLMYDARRDGKDLHDRHPELGFTLEQVSKVNQRLYQVEPGKMSQLT